MQYKSQLYAWRMAQCALPVLLAAGCALPSFSKGASVLPPSSAGALPQLSAFAPPPTEGQSPPLYARSGGVVEAPAAGSTETATPTRHAADPGEGSRASIIELYQGAVEDREQLELELETQRAFNSKLQLELDNALRNLAQKEVDLAAVSGSRSEVDAQVRDLAARLTTAQIQRLETQKQLYELLLEQERTRASRTLEASSQAKAMQLPAPSLSGDGSQ